MVPERLDIFLDQLKCLVAALGGGMEPFFGELDALQDIDQGVAGEIFQSRENGGSRTDLIADDQQVRTGIGGKAGGLRSAEGALDGQAVKASGKDESLVTKLVAQEPGDDPVGEGCRHC